MINETLRWTNYEHGSWFWIEFGVFDAKVNIMGRNAAGVPNEFGIIVSPHGIDFMHPGSGFQGTDPTLDQAKARAEQMLSNMLIPAAEAMEKYNRSKKDDVLT